MVLRVITWKWIRRCQAIPLCRRTDRYCNSDGVFFWIPAYHVCLKLWRKAFNQLVRFLRVFLYDFFSVSWNVLSVILECWRFRKGGGLVFWKLNLRGFLKSQSILRVYCCSSSTVSSFCIRVNNEIKCISSSFQVFKLLIFIHTRG